jgi:hypothetical protein
LRSKETDGKAWIQNPGYNFVYNKLWLSKTQNITCAPAGVEPENYPVFYKPITNLYSLGAKSFKANSPVKGRLHPGLFWSEYLEGKHWTFDCSFKNGSVSDVFALRADKKKDVFSCWGEIKKPDLTEAKDWISNYLVGYKGNLNFEFIGDKIIEVHLRNSDQMQKMKESGHGVCVPFFGSPGRYDVNQKMLQVLNKTIKGATSIVTIDSNGNPEAGVGNTRRLGYVTSNDKSLAFETKNYILQHIVKKRNE